MSSHNETPKKAFSPAHMAGMASRMALRTVVESPVVKPTAVEATAEAAPEPVAGDIVERDGKRYRYTAVMREVENRRTGEWEAVPHTYRSYYSHTDPATRMQGPGWDGRFHLADPEYAMEKHGRTFTTEQVSQPAGRRISMTEDTSAIPPEMLYEGANGDLYDVSNAMPDTPLLVLKEIKNQQIAPGQ